MSQDIIDALLRERAGAASKGDADTVNQIDEQLAHYGYEDVDELEKVERVESTAPDDTGEAQLLESLRLEIEQLRSEGNAVNAERDTLREKLTELETVSDERDALQKKVTELEAAAAEREKAGGPAPVDAKPAPAKSTRSR